MGFNKRKLSPIKLGEIIDYKSVELLQSYLTNQGKIMPRRSTNLTLKQQRQLSKAVKQARSVNLLAFVHKSVSLPPKKKGFVRKNENIPRKKEDLVRKSEN